MNGEVSMRMVGSVQWTHLTPEKLILYKTCFRCPTNDRQNSLSRYEEVLSILVLSGGE